MVIPQHRAYCTPLYNTMKKLRVIPTPRTHSRLCQYVFCMKGNLHDDKNIDRIFVFTECAWDEPIVVRIHHRWVEDSVNLNKHTQQQHTLSIVSKYPGVRNSKFKIWLLKKTSSWQLPWSDHSSCQARILLCSPFQSQWPAWRRGGGILNLQNKSDFSSTRWLIALISWFVLVCPSLRFEWNGAQQAIPQDLSQFPTKQESFSMHLNWTQGWVKSNTQLKTAGASGPAWGTCTPHKCKEMVGESNKKSQHKTKLWWLTIKGSARLTECERGSHCVQPWMK